MSPSCPRGFKLKFTKFFSTSEENLAQELSRLSVLILFGTISYAKANVAIASDLPPLIN